MGKGSFFHVENTTSATQAYFGLTWSHAFMISPTKEMKDEDRRHSEQCRLVLGREKSGERGGGTEYENRNTIIFTHQK